MATIDLDKVGSALLHLRDDASGQAALQQLRTSLDAFTGGLPQGLQHSEKVFLLRTLMADLSIDHPSGIPNVGGTVGGRTMVTAAGTPVVKNVAGFAVVANK